MENISRFKPLTGKEIAHAILAGTAFTALFICALAGAYAATSTGQAFYARLLPVICIVWGLLALGIHLTPSKKGSQR